MVDQELADHARSLLHVGVLRRRPDTVVLVVAGEVDILSAPLLSENVLAEVDRAGRLVLDLSGVSFLGSTGIACLLQARRAAQRRGVELLLTRLSDRTVRSLELAGILDLFRLADEAARVA